MIAAQMQMLTNVKQVCQFENMVYLLQRMFGGGVKKSEKSMNNYIHS
jgi:hypothetical protein